MFFIYFGHAIAMSSYFKLMCTIFNDTPSDGRYAIFLKEVINPAVLQVSPSNASIEFKDVRFSYVPGRTILDRISFTVAPGSKVAIVGGSGCG